MTVEVPLRRLFRVVNGGTPTSEPMNWDGEVAWATPVDLATCDGSILSVTQRTITAEGLRSGSTEVPAGSLILSTRAPIGYVAQTARPAAFNQGCRALVPRVDLDIRYYRYVLMALKERLVAAGQGSTFVELSSEGLASTKVPRLSVAAQRAIADYLDTETARIDALIAKKRRLSVLIERRFQAQVSRVLWPTGAETMRLKYLCGVPTSGNRDHQSFLAGGGGVPCLRGLNVRPGRIQSDQLLHIGEDAHVRQQATQLRAGDVVIVRSGAAGAAATVPPELDGANCVDLVIVRRSASVVSAWLEYIINSREAQEQVIQRQAGAILSHFNAVDAGDLRLPRIDRRAQEDAVATLDEARHLRDGLVGRLNRQVALLQGHRQGLITAAVMGELEIPGVA